MPEGPGEPNTIINDTATIEVVAMAATPVVFISIRTAWTHAGTLATYAQCREIGQLLLDLAADGEARQASAQQLTSVYDTRPLADAERLLVSAKHPEDVT